MVTERVEIIVSERGVRQTSRAIRSIGTTARTAAVAVAGLAAALATVAAGRVLSQVASDAIQAAAAFEGYQVRLRALLGSQDDANRALQNFVELSARTPFAVSQIVAGSTSLAAAALGNRERLEELTQTAANLAAVTGLSFQAAAENLARALSAGIGAADLFRERGVRALIEEIEGIPDATQLTADELEDAFRNIFGEGGTFGTSAEQLSLTLAGALSNIGDAAENFRVRLGQALSPVVINAARQVFIPFFQNLERLVEGNEESIRNLAAQGLAAIIDAFILAADTGLAFASGIAEIRQFIITLTGSLFDAELSIAEFDLSLNKLANSLGLVSDADLAFQQNEVDLLRAGVDAIAEDVFRASQNTTEFTDRLQDLRNELAELGRLANNTDFTELVEPPDTGPTADDLGGGDDVVPVDEEALRAQLAAQSELLDLVRDRRLEELEAINPRERQLALIDEEIARVSALAAAGADQALAEAEINELIAERARLASQTDFGRDFSTAITTGLEQGFADAIQSGRSFSEALGDSFQQQANQALIDGFSESFSALQEGLQSVFDNVANSLTGIFGDSFGALGGALGDALSGALQFVALQGLSALFGGGGNSTTASSANVTSAVNSAQAVRGIVAGPQEIAIAQVDRAIGEANEEVVGELQVQTGILRSLLAAVQATTAGGLDADTSALAFGSAPAASI